MPIIRNASGHSRYISEERPEKFFLGNEEEYRRRVAEARNRVIDTIRFAAVPLTGTGTCHEVYGVGPELKNLTNFVDLRDGRRSRLLVEQRTREENEGLAPHEHRRRAPQDIKRRRSALFGGTDIPGGYFRNKYGRRFTREERAQFIDRMRWHLINDAVMEMFAKDEIARLNDIWYVKVSVVDAHPSARRQRRRKSHRSSHRVKRDDRSFHGRPNRDRVRVLIAA